MPLDATGYTAPRAADILDDIRSDFLDTVEAQTGVRPVVDWGRDTFLGPMTAVVASRLGSLASATQAIYDARNPNNAVGVGLSDLAAVSGITRRDATFSVLLATLDGDESTEVLAGAFRFRAGGVDWELTEDVTIPAGGTTSAVFQALDAGPYTADLGSDVSDGVEILTPTIGVDNVTTGAVTAGRLAETDPELALRRLQSLQVRGSTSAAAIRARILEALPSVEACLVFEHDQPWTTAIEGVTLDPHSIAVIIHPELLDADDRETLAALLYDHVTTGVGMMGDVEYVIDGEGLAAKSARWAYASLIDVTITLAVRMEPVTPGLPEPPAFDDAEPVIEADVIAYAESLSMGTDLRQLSVRGIVGDVDGVRSVTSLTFDAGDPTRIDDDGNLIIYAAEKVGTVTVVVTEAA